MCNLLGGGGFKLKKPKPKMGIAGNVGFFGFSKVFLETRFHLVLTRRIL